MKIKIKPNSLSGSYQGRELVDPLIIKLTYFQKLKTAIQLLFYNHIFFNKIYF